MIIIDWQEARINQHQSSYKPRQKKFVLKICKKSTTGYWNEQANLREKLGMVMVMFNVIFCKFLYQVSQNKFQKISWLGYVTQSLKNESPNHSIAQYLFNILRCLTTEVIVWTLSPRAWHWSSSCLFSSKRLSTLNVLNFKVDCAFIK